MNDNKTFDLKANNIRSLAILIVVIGHSIIIFDPDWGIYYPQLSSPFLMYVKHYINVVQMPLFFSLSGYCYLLSPWWKKETYFQFIIKKIKRLILPFIVVSIVWILPIRLLSNYPFWSGLSIGRIILRFLMGKDTGHLWYLGALLLVFCLAGMWEIVSEKVFTSSVKGTLPILLFILLFLLSLGSSLLPEEFFIRPCAKYLFWFYVGCLLQKHKDFCNRQRQLKWSVLLLASILVSIVVFVPFSSRLLYKIIEYLGTISFIVSCYCFVPDKKNVTSMNLSRDSFGIYLFHSPMLYPIYCYLNWLRPLPMVLINILFCGGISILITRLLRRQKWTKWILGE